MCKHNGEGHHFEHSAKLKLALFRAINSLPGSHSSHLVVQIFLQNHGYTFHPEDLEKGQGDSR